MRICFLTRSDVVHPHVGGMETQGKLLTEGLVKTGHQVVMITTAHPRGLKKVVRNGVEIHYLNNAASGVYSSGWWEGSVQKFFRLQPEKKFDIVVSQSVAGWGYLKKRGEFDVPCVAIIHGTTFRDLKTRWAGISSLLDFLRFVKELAIRVWRYLFRWVFWFKRFDAIIAVSEAVRGSSIKNYFLDPKKVFTVHNGVDTTKFEIRNSKSETVGKTILYIGRLDRDKGLELLLSVAASLKSQIPNFKLLLVGGGLEFNHLNNQTKKLGLTDVIEFVGQVPYEETPKYYQQADVFVLPSAALEGLPMTVLEAMAAGLPVVASKIGGISEAVADGETGFLVGPGNVEGLTEVLKRLLTDADLRLKMGQRAREVAVDKFSQEKMVTNTLTVLESVLS